MRFGSNPLYDDTVNLNERRKRKARAERAADADAKRLMFGRNKAERRRDELQKAADIRKLDGAKRDRDDDTR